MALLVLLMLLMVVVVVVVVRKKSSAAPVKRENGTGTRTPPGPRAMPVVGHLHMLGSSPHKALRTLAQRYGPVMSLRLGRNNVVVASSAAAAEQFLKKHDLIFASRPPSAAGRIFAYSSDVVFAPYGHQWRQLRKLATLELLTPRRIASFTDARMQDVMALCRSILHDSAECTDRVVDVRRRLTELTFNTITLMLMGKRFFGSSVEDEGEAAECTRVLAETFEVCGEFPIGDYLPLLRFLDPVEARMKSLAAYLDDFLESNIQQHERNRANGVAYKDDFLYTMLELRDKGEEELQKRNSLKGMMVNLLAGGTDTSAVTLEWTLAEMINHPDVMAKAQAEVDSVVMGRSGEDEMVHESDLPNLHYLSAVVKESMRLHPAVPLLVPHKSTQDASVMGYSIPSATTLIVNAYAVGRDELVWDRPLEYKPDRFVGSDVDARGQHFGLIPFGSGRRMCPGLNLALSTVHLALANLLHAFDWRAADEHGVDTVKEKYGLTLLMANKLQAQALPRRRTR